jgi:hypothetical protein
MGLLMRRRRPLMRVAAGAALGTVAYQAGKRGAQQAPMGAPAPAVQDTTRASASAGQGPAGELERLTQLHMSGALSDAEFAAAKARVLST